MSKQFPEWWKHGQKVETAKDGILTLNIAEDAEYWLTDANGKEVYVFSADIIGPANPQGGQMNDITALTQRLKVYAEEFSYPVLSPDDCRVLVEALEKAQRKIAQVTAERDALREGEVGTAKHSNTRAAADIYFQLVEECDIPAGGSLVEFVDELKERVRELEFRTVTVKLPDEVLRLAQAPQHLSKHDQLCWMSGANWMRMEVVKLNPAAGIQVIEGEG